MSLINKNNIQSSKIEINNNSDNFGFLKKTALFSCLICAVLFKQGCYESKSSKDTDIKNQKTIELKTKTTMELENLLEIYIQRRYKDYHQLEKEIRSYTKTYIVKPKDTLRSISIKYKLKSTDDLIKLNKILGKNINKNIHPGDDILVPIDTSIYYENMDQLIYAEQILKNNQLFSNLNGNNEIQNIHIESIRYPQVQSLGLPNVIEGFMDNQENGLWVENPNVVDKMWITTVGCLHALREMARQSIKFSDLAGFDEDLLKKTINYGKIIKRSNNPQKSKTNFGYEDINGIKEKDISYIDNKLAEIARLNNENISDNIAIGQGINENSQIGNEYEYLMVEDVDAWMVGELLENIGYKKMFNFLLECFDPQRLTSIDPIAPIERNRYKNYVLTLGEFLEKNDKRLTGTYVAFFFNFSSYRDDMARYMKDKTSKHYNTHQAMFGRNINLNFQAKELGMIENGKRLRNKFKSISVIDFILDFIQVRGDFDGALGSGIRGITLNSIQDYFPLIHISVNGEKINLAKEIDNYNQGLGTILIDSQDQIKIFGPALIDAEHQNNYPNDAIKRKNLNMRVRFFFEFIPFYHTTEIFVPSSYSTFARNDFQQANNKLHIKGLYCLNEGETLEQALKDEIIIHEKLDLQDTDFNKKFRFYYGLQTKALQLSGFLKENSIINPGACNSYRLIPYYENKNINTVFGSYIDQKKLEQKIKNEKMSGIKDYIDIYLYPNHNPGKIYRSIVEQINQNSNKFELYPHLYLINHLNFMQRGILLYMIGDRAIKTDKSILPDDIVKGYLPASHTIFVTLGELDEILKTINKITSLEAPVPKDIDKTIISNIATTEQNRSFLEFILYNETTCTGNIFYGKNISDLFSEKTLTQIYGRKTVKRLAQCLKIQLDNHNIELYKKDLDFLGRSVPLIGFEAAPDYEKINLISSISDYQIQSNIINGWGKNGWITKEQMVKAIQLCQSDRVINLVNGQSYEHKTQYQSDINKLKKLAYIVSKNNLQKSDFIKIDKILTSLGIIDSGAGTNIVGKVMFTYFLQEKIKLNTQNTYGFLLPMGLDIGEIYNDGAKIESLNKIILLSNNAGENDTLLALAENYIIRITDHLLKGNIITQDVYSENDLGKWKGNVEYGKNTFVKHINNYISQLESGESTKNSIIKHKLKEFIKQFEQNLKKHQGTNTLTIDFINDKALKNYLKSNGLSTSILPSLDEFSGNNFQKSVFNYVNKSYDYGKLSKFQENLIIGSVIALGFGLIIFLLTIILIKKLLKNIFNYFRENLNINDDKQINQNQILQITFNNISAEELENSIGETIEQDESSTIDEQNPFEKYRNGIFKV